MKKKDVDQLATAFETAIQLSKADRDRFVSKFAVKFPELEPKLQRLLAADASQDDLVQRIVTTAASSVDDDTFDPWLGKKLGPWTLSERIGAGGMGAVFLAYRDDGEFEQTVAIKVMGSQILSETAAARFRFERQTLANLKHPNIGTLIDGGSTDLNLPYLVMEYIEGLSIDEYCETKSLSINERLALFRKVCAAVDYAHRNLIVHRDLKPDNILVEESGEPKLLDFGVARLIEQQDEIDDERNVGLPLTQPGSRVLTLEYASPEQVRGETVTIATDIYALGVLLYQLLADASPYGDKPTTIRDFEDVILNHTPKPPSAVTSIAERNSASASENSNMKLFRRTKRLSQDLDNIVLKCLQKDPDHRYSSPKELSDDLQRYLNDEPVEARPAAWTYVTGKFLKRNIAAVTATAAVLIFLLGVTGFYTVRLSTERNNAESAAAEALLAATEAEEITKFLIDLLQGASPAVAQGSEFTVKELLSEGVEKIDAIEDQPDLKARLLTHMVEIHIFLGDRRKAQVLARKARDLFASNLAKDPKVRVRAYHEYGETLMFNDEHEAAIKNQRLALDFASDVYGEQSKEAANIEARLGTTYFQAGDYERAIATMESARENYAAAAGTDRENYIDILGNLAIALDAAGLYARSTEIYATLVDSSERISGKLHPNTVIRLSNRGFVESILMELTSARETLLEAINRSEEVFEPYHYSHGFYRSALSLVHANLGEFEKAEAAAGYAVQHTEEHANLASRWYFEALQKETAIQLLSAPSANITDELETRLADAEEEFGENTRRPIEVKLQMAQSAFARKLYAQADRRVNEVLNHKGAIPYHRVRNAYLLRARIYDANGDYSQAAKIYENEIAIRKRANLYQAPISLALRQHYGTHLRLSGKLIQSSETLQGALAIAEKRLPENNWHTALVKLEYARTLDSQEQDGAAAALAAAAYTDLSAIFAEDHPQVQGAAELVRKLNS